MTTDDGDPNRLAQDAVEESSAGISNMSCCERPVSTKECNLIAGGSTPDVCARPALTLVASGTTSSNDVLQRKIKQQLDGRARVRFQSIALLVWMLGLTTASWLLLLLGGYATPNLTGFRLFESAGLTRLHSNMSNA